MRAACEKVGAPADLVQSLPAPPLATSQELMRLPVRQTWWLRRLARNSSGSR